MYFIVWLIVACKEDSKKEVSEPQTIPNGRTIIEEVKSSKYQRPEGEQTEINQGDLLITEIMHNPEQVNDWKGEWIEIYNNSEQTLDLKSLDFKSTQEDGFQISDTHLLKPTEYFVLAANGFEGTNGGVFVDYTYDYKKFKLTEQEEISISIGGKEIDRVTYKAKTPENQPRHSLSLDPLQYQSRDSETNNNWCPASSAYGQGDFGTPKKKNDPCYQIDNLQKGDLIITEIMFHPTKVPQWKGEWFEIFNATQKVINLQNITLKSTNGEWVTLEDKGYIFPNEHFVFGVSIGSATGGVPVDLRYNYNELKMFEGDSLSLYANETLVDSVTWTPNDWPTEEGIALNLSPYAYGEEKNDNPAVWCLAKEIYGAGDLGSPKKANFNCSEPQKTRCGNDGYQPCKEMDSKIITE